jgi:hypothetical protein
MLPLQDKTVAHGAKKSLTGGWNIAKNRAPFVGGDPVILAAAAFALGRFSPVTHRPLYRPVAIPEI